MNERLLVIDDDAHMRDFLSDVLSTKGFESIDTAADISSALSAVYEKEYDLILSDIMLDDATGIDFLREIRDKGIETPVLLMTGEPDMESAIEAVRLGASDYIRKPVQVKSIIEAVTKALNQKAKQEQHLKKEAENKTRLTLEIETYRMHLERLQGQIDSAADIYKNLVNLRENPCSVGISWRHRPLATLGGDFIDIREKGNSLDIIIADVAGHDIGTSLHTVLLKAFFEENCHKGNNGLTLFHLLNRHILDSTDNERMITALFLRLNLKTYECDIVSAAHPWIFIRREGEPEPVRPFDAGGDVLGLLDNPEFTIRRIQLFPGDRLFVHTDGILNASRLNTASGVREKLKLEEFDRFFRQYPNAGLEEMLSGIWGDVLDFCDNMPKDDMLLMGMEL